MKPVDIVTDNRPSTTHHTLRTCATAVLLMSVTLALLWHFSNIWGKGQHFIQEPKPLVLLAETVGLIVIVIFTVYVLIREVVEERDRIRRKRLDEGIVLGKRITKAGPLFHER